MEIKTLVAKAHEEEVIEIKMAYNEGRPYKHGKKF